MYTDLNNLCVRPEASVQQAIGQMETSRIGIVLVVGAEGRLLGTITDGDVRRSILGNFDLDQPIADLLALKWGGRYSTPVTALDGTDPKNLLRLLQLHQIRHLPLVDHQQRVTALVTMDDFVQEQEQPLQAVIMAGGVGHRLRPLTEQLPKPMLPVGDRPVMELIVQQLRNSGVKRINVTVHHQADKITEHFGDGRDFGVEITYVTEDQPLGTAGALAMMEAPTETVLVINGDILTHLDFRAMLAYHRENQADLTMAVQQYDVQVPYGVVELDGPLVNGLTEKPELSFLVNAGIYLLEPAIHHLIPTGKRSDMTDLIQRVIDDGRPVAAFPLREYWTDIGDLADYQQAQEHFENQAQSA